MNEPPKGNRWILDEMKAGRITLEAFLKNKGITEGKFTALAESIIADWDLSGYFPEGAEAKKHFINAINRKLETERDKANGKSNAGQAQQEDRLSKRRGIDPTDVKREDYANFSF